MTGERASISLAATYRALSEIPLSFQGPTRAQFIGIFLLSLSMLESELILTRLFSVTLWYHFAFMAVSVALLGIAAGGVRAARLAPPGPAELGPLLARATRHYALAVAGALLVLLGVPFVYRISIGALVSLLLIYAAATLPFYFAGYILALLFRSHARSIGRLYAADLSGAGAGALLAVPLLDWLSAPSALIATAGVGAASSILLARGRGERTSRRDLLSGSLVAAGLFLFALLGQVTPLLRVDFAKDHMQDDLLLDRWNALSRVTVTPRGTPNWGTSERYKGPRPETLWLKIDSEAGTPITRWDGDPAKVDALRYDITAFVYHLRSGGKALVIGPGGGRDVLTALIMGAREVTAVEINPAIVDAVRRTFGDYAGRLYDDPRVTLVVGEGREFLRRVPREYDVIQASLIDTWAASAAGAYVFSEANLYTREAFREYLDRLSDQGVLTMSRWHFKDLPTETLRITALSMRALLERGVADPSAHIILVKRTTWDWFYRLSEPRDGIGTILVKKTPFLPEEVAAARRAAEALDFQVLLAPGGGGDPLFERLVASRDPEGFAKSYPVDVSPPSDERPFFFYMLRMRDLSRWLGANPLSQGVMQNNVRAVFVLAALLLIVLVLSLVLLLLPLKRPALDAPPAAALVYFAAIGLGFILVEIPLIQRFILYLGHPLYALSVVLSGLLVGAGMGSLLSTRLGLAGSRRALLVLLLLVAFAAFGAPRLLGATLGAATPLRVALSLALLLPLGLAAGIPFPLGVRLLGDAGARWVPWMWAVNGAFSVLASVLAMALAMSFGFGTTLAAGLAAYAIATAIAHRGPKFASLGAPPGGG